MARFTVLFIFNRSSNNAFFGARETDVRAAKPILSPFAQNKNLIELTIFFLEIVHPDLYPGRVWGLSIFSLCTPLGEILGRSLLIAQKVLLVTPYAYYSSMLSYTVLVIFPFIDHVMAQQLSQRLELN